MVNITLSVLESIQSTLGTLSAEKGGIIGGTSNTISAYYFDKDAHTDHAHYFPSVQQNNSIIRQWAQSGISFLGIIHSHQHGDMRLSGTDIAFAREIIKANLPKIKFLYFPIVASTFDECCFEITIYRISLDTIEIEKTQILNHIMEEEK